MANPSIAQSTALPGAKEIALLSKLKTAYLYNIAKFVSWDDGSGEVVLCLDESSPLVPYATELTNRPLANNRYLSVSTKSSPKCHIFFHDQVSDDYGAITNSSTAWSPSTLLISDLQNFDDNRYAIQLFSDEGRLHFTVNSDALAQSEYRISSKLLRLARKSRP